MTGATVLALDSFARLVATVVFLAGGGQDGGAKDLAGLGRIAPDLVGVPLRTHQGNYEPVHLFLWEGNRRRFLKLKDHPITLR